MKPQTFNKLVISRLSHCEQTLCDKGEEYSRNGDRLWNFKVAGKMTGDTPEKALLGMLLKHWVSVIDMVESEGIISDKMLDDKIDDSVNYMLLLNGLLVERNQNLQINPIKPVPEHFKPIPPIDEGYLHGLHEEL